MADVTKFIKPLGYGIKEDEPKAPSGQYSSSLDILLDIGASDTPADFLKKLGDRMLKNLGDRPETLYLIEQLEKDLKRPSKYDPQRAEKLKAMGQPEVQPSGQFGESALGRAGMALTAVGESISEVIPHKPGEFDVGAFLKAPIDYGTFLAGAPISIGEAVINPISKALKGEQGLGEAVGEIKGAATGMARDVLHTFKDINKALSPKTGNIKHDIAVDAAQSRMADKLGHYIAIAEMGVRPAVRAGKSLKIQKPIDVPVPAHIAKQMREQNIDVKYFEHPVTGDVSYRITRKGEGRPEVVEITKSPKGEQKMRTFLDLPEKVQKVAGPAVAGAAAVTAVGAAKDDEKAVAAGVLGLFGRRKKKPSIAPVIIKNASKRFNMPIHKGKLQPVFSKKGYSYNKQTKALTIKNANDINSVNRGLGEKVWAETDISKRVGSLPDFKAFSKTVDPEKGDPKAGFSEFLHKWLLNDAIIYEKGEGGTVPPKVAYDLREAKQTRRQFNQFLKENPELAKELRAHRQELILKRNQSAEKTLLSQIDLEGKGIPKSFSDRVAGGEHMLYTLLNTMTNSKSYLIKYEKQARGMPKISELQPVKRRFNWKKLRPEWDVKFDPTSSPSLLAEYLEKTAMAKASYMVMHGTTDWAGNPTGPSLRKAMMKAGKKKQNDVVVYAYAKHGLDLLKKGINPGIVGIDGRHGADAISEWKKKAEYVVKTKGTKEVREAAAGLTAFSNRVKGYVVDAGGLDEATAEAFFTAHPFYIPMKRVFDEMERIPGRGRGASWGDTPVASYRIKGSTRMIQNPIHSVIQATADMINLADRIRVGRAIVGMAKDNHRVGGLIREVPAKKVQITVDLENYMNQLEDMGFELTEEGREQLLTVYINSGKYSKDQPIVSFMEEGKRKFYEIEPHLYQAIKGMDNAAFPIIVPWLTTMAETSAKLLRVGATGLQAGFAMSNTLRDFPTFLVQTEFGGGALTAPARYIRAAVRKFVTHPIGRLSTGKWDEMVRLYKATGVDMSTMIGLDVKGLQEAQRAIVSNDLVRMATMPFPFIGHPLEALKSIIQATEAIPRMAEMESALKVGRKIWPAPPGKNSPQAVMLSAIAGSKVTVNFKEAGTVGQSLNRIVAFWNAAVRGPAIMARFAKRHPYRFLLRSMAMITAPTVALWWLYKDEEWYQQLPAWDRSGFWHIHAGSQELTDLKGKKHTVPLIIRIPIPFEIGTFFKSYPEAWLNYMYTNNKEDFLKEIGQATQKTMPGLSGVPVPTIITPAVENYPKHGYSFYMDKELIAPYLRDEITENQFHGGTSEAAKQVSKMMGEVSRKVSGDLLDLSVSPIKIDNAIRGYTGGMLTDILRGVEGAAEDYIAIVENSNLPNDVKKIMTSVEYIQAAAKKEREKQASDLPVVGRFISRQMSPERKARKIKQLRKEAKTRIKKLKEADRRDEAEQVRINYNKKWGRKSSDRISKY